MAQTRYRVRLEAPNSDDFRVLFVPAGSEEEARRIAEVKEQKIVEFRASEKDLKEFEKRSKERGRPVFPLVAHNQSEPYEVKSVISREDWLAGKWRGKKKAVK